MIRVAALVLVALAAAGAFAQPRGPQSPNASALREGFERRMELRFMGVRTVEAVRGERRSTYRERVWIDRGRSRTEVLGRNRQPRSITVTDGRTMARLDPRTKKTTLSPTLPGSLPAGPGREIFAAMAEGGRENVSMREGETVAGRATRLVEIKYRNGKVRLRVWIDRAEPVALKREAFAEDGRRLGGYEFERVTYSPDVPAGAFETKPAGYTVTRLDDIVRDLCKDLGMAPRLLPPASGYTMRSYRKPGDGNDAVVAQFYADDDVRLTLFVMRREPDTDLIERLAGERTSAYRWSVGATRYLLMGQASTAQLRRYAATTVP